MARIDNLTNFLSDVSSAIKAKLDDNTPILASQFDTKIREIKNTGAIIFATIAEMNATTNVPEDTLAIVYGEDYVGTYRFDNGSWTEIGSKSNEQKTMDNLNALDGSTDQYEGLGGTEAEVEEILDEILGVQV